MSEQIAAQLDPQLLTEVARRALDRPALTLDRWQLQPIGYANVSPGSRGLYRISGNGHDGAATLVWSVVLKVCVAPDSERADEPDQPFFWRREALIYQSDWLATLPEELAAPRCLGIIERPDRRLWLWLEDVADQAEQLWPLERYGVTARGLGRMSGAWLEHPQLRATPWLSRGLLRSWVANAGAQIDLLEHPTLATHPLLRELYSAPLVADVQQLWAERERFFAGLERLPQTLCHHDLWRHNLAARPGSAVQPQTVVLDWEVAGLGAPGEDVGNLLGVSLLNFDLPAEQAAAAAETLLSEYLAGLRSTGRACAADEAAAVRGAFAAAAALRCVFSTACWPAAIALDESGRFRAETEQRWRRPIETIFAQWASVTRFLLEQAAAARRWLKL